MNSKEPVRFLFPLLRTPAILSRIFRLVVTKHIFSKKAYRRADGASELPLQQISFRITNACNLRCKTCGQWGETGYNLSKPTSELKDLVPLERYLQLVEEVKNYKPIYYIWGGEPLLYPGLMDLTRAIKKNKSLLSLVTNATLLADKAEEIVKQGWDALMFSLDGPEAVHDKIRGRAGTFAKVKQGISQVKYFKKEKKSPLPWLMALVTVSVDNAAHLDEIFEAAAELGVDCVIVYYSWFTTEQIGLCHTSLLQKKLQITPTAWRGYLFDHNVNTGALKQSIDRIGKRKWNFPYLFIPELSPDQLERYYQEPDHFFGYGPCISPWYVTEIMANGDVTPCRDYPDYVVGNIRKQPLMEIWNNERYKAFRKALKDCGGTFPICARCCGLMGW
jgi:radical SAM protein with 4Fe4S-binding SPASM domain